MPNNDSGPNSPSGEILFYDFIDILQSLYPHASWCLVRDEIAFARHQGPIAARLTMLAQGVFEATVPIGFGHFARIELEYDSQGRLQPVVGEFVRRA